MWNDNITERLWYVLGATILIAVGLPVSLFVLAVIIVGIVSFPWVAGYIGICATIASCIAFRREIKDKFNDLRSKIR